MSNILIATCLFIFVFVCLAVGATGYKNQYTAWLDWKWMLIVSAIPVLVFEIWALFGWLRGV